MDAKPPVSHSLWSPYDTVRDAADSLGVTISDETAKSLAMDVEYHIHEIIETAVKFMRHSKRRQLTTSDISYALKILNIEPLYGYDNSQPLNYKETMVGAGGQTLYYIDDNEIEFEKLINQELPKVPRQVNFTAHWLAVEGVQPMVPQNPLPSEIKNLPAVVRGATSSMLGNDILSLGNKSEDAEGGAAGGKKSGTAGGSSTTDKDLEIKPLIKHVLSKELKLYFDKVVEVLVSTDPEKEHLRNAALTSLKNDPGLHQLVPYFIQFVAEQITNQLRNIEILSTMLEVILALADNKTIFLDPYVHALMPCILTLLLAKRIGPVIKNPQSEESQQVLKSQLAIREFAAILLEHIIKVYGSSYSTLRPRVTRTLLRALLDSTKPVGTHYGALLGLKNMGVEVLKLVLIGNLKVWYLLVIEENKNEFEKGILINTVLETLRKLKVDNKLTNGESDDMDVDVSEDIKEKLQERIGKPLSELVLQQADGKQIVNGIFFGEVSV
ncbi:Transcription initiation factor TFIID subunit 6 [Candida viswanathii]|uniref:TBP-associated factor 6 n=1 Tax=Candida viswanathii TaxID=5486 RepID=A0A367YFW3_9ASCO|nr:Transcription initiation factor TFIID subunit 6 [Candida viswanathii]